MQSCCILPECESPLCPAYPHCIRYQSEGVEKSTAYVYIEFGTIYSFRHPLGVLEGIPVVNGVCAKSLQSCLTVCDPMDCSLPDSSVRGILQTIILKCLLQGMDLPDSGTDPMFLMFPAISKYYFLF